MFLEEKFLIENGEVLATSIKTKDLYINFKNILDKDKLYKELKRIFPTKLHLLKSSNKKNKYILLKKHLSLDQINN